MTNLDQKKPGEKSGKSKKKKSKKAEQKSAKPEQVLAAEELIDATIPSSESVETEVAETAAEIEQPVAAVAPVQDVAPVETAPAATAPPEPVAPAEPVARVASFRERMAVRGFF